MAELHETQLGRKFYERDVPKIADALTQIAKEMELMRKLIEGADPIEIARLATLYLNSLTLPKEYGK